MKRVRTFILWIITNGRFITISFPRKILCKADLRLFYPDACRSLQGLFAASDQFLRCVDRGWKIMPVMVKWDLWTQG